MPIIRFVKTQPELTVPDGVTLMDALRAAGLPVASSCQGDGVCAKCRVTVVEGAANLSTEGPVERRLRERNRFAPDVRISCQTTVHGDVTVDTSYW